ncbi:hypothetical protein FA15DRAFT_729225 [Coprinopsis marcescibilis]|uniref:CFEM domain-containing protein n=1 Tax=Coprinopsis marcescibilis TaxID=230819 RepID=A0A5C3KFT1_COPMA|nr:hypothetical protein FA15DRAFT_729225 [Coprinopsis marcescibilis]
MLLKSLLLSFVSISSVLAQSGRSPCSDGCVQAAIAATGKCTGVADIDCICGNAQYPIDLANCLQTHCKADSTITDAANEGLKQSCEKNSVTASGNTGPTLEGQYQKAELKHGSTLEYGPTLAQTEGSKLFFPRQIPTIPAMSETLNRFIRFIHLNSPGWTKCQDTRQLLHECSKFSYSTVAESVTTSVLS